MDCIYSDEEDRILYIEPDECIDCAVCVSTCPAGAIFADDDTPAESMTFLAINALWFEDKDAVRKKVDAFSA